MSLDLPVNPPCAPTPGRDGAGPSVHELGTARLVQQHLFPRELPRVPGWDWSGLCQPARAVAGDYYDLFEAAPGQVAVALGDVSGKGLGPALIMASLHALVRSRLPHRLADLPGLVADFDRYLRAVTPEAMFVTLFLGVLDVRTGRLCYVNAGHPAPFLVAGQGREPCRLSAGGTVLGILPGAAWEEGEADLGRGSVLALFSDGISDAANGDGARFGEAPVGAVLRASGALPAAAVLKRLLAAVTRFIGPAEPADDLSLVVIRRQSEASERRGRGDASQGHNRQGGRALPFVSASCVRG
jgi:sigma-B regulation protein RsbU (phosphoserine phosphatase)